MRLLLVACIALATTTVHAQTDWMPAEAQMRMPKDTFKDYRNPDGSCVQCSIGMVGTWMNVPAAANLLWRTEYGPAVRGGSHPGRVRSYCDARNIAIWNITGSETMAWMEWAARNRRGAAIGFKPNHFCTLVGMSDDAQTFYVVDNNTPYRVDRYTRSEFIRRHLQSGRWCVVLQGPAPPPALKVIPWWE